MSSQSARGVSGQQLSQSSFRWQQALPSSVRLSVNTPLITSRPVTPMSVTPMGVAEEELIYSRPISPLNQLYVN